MIVSNLDGIIGCDGMIVCEVSREKVNVNHERVARWKLRATRSFQSILCAYLVRRCMESAVSSWLS